MSGDDPYARLRAPAVWHGLVAGAELAERGAWWQAHEAWEHAWRAYAAPDRGVIQGLIQLVAANHHLARRDARAASAVIERARRRLRERGHGAWPFDVEALAHLADGLSRRLAAGETPVPEAIVLLARLRRAMPHPGD